MNDHDQILSESFSISDELFGPRPRAESQTNYGIADEITERERARLLVSGLFDDPTPALNSAHSAHSVNSAKRQNNEQPVTDLNQWERPVPFREYDLPKFPTETLPSWLKSFVEGLAEESQTPVDLPAMQALSICATSVARNVVIEARPGWREPLNIFTLVVLESANRKSKVVTEATKPLAVFEADLLAAMQDEIAEAINEHKILEARLERAQKDCAKLDGDDLKRRKEEARQIALELEHHQIPVAPCFFVDDVTSEALASKLCEQDGRMALFSAEGGIFETMAGRYSNGTPSIDVYLKSHAGDSLRVDRRHRAERIERPALTIGLAVQPEILRGLADKPGFRGRGLLARFLYALPESKLGKRKARVAPLPDEVRRTYEQYVIKLAAIKPVKTDEGDEGAEPILLRLPKDADVYFELFQNEVEPNLAEGGEYSSFRDWAGKLCGAVLRLAGILHLADHAMKAPNVPLNIPAQTLKRAIEIGCYLIPHAQAAYAEMGADPLIENAKYVLRWLRREQINFLNEQIYSLTKRDIFNGTKGRFKKVTELDPVITLLEEHGFIRPMLRSKPESENNEKSNRGRKASQLYEVNPYLYDAAQNSQNSQNCKNTDNSANSANSAQQMKDSKFEAREVGTI
jgi:hypothetical protein